MPSVTMKTGFVCCPNAEWWILRVIRVRACSSSTSSTNIHNTSKLSVPVLLCRGTYCGKQENELYPYESEAVIYREILYPGMISWNLCRAHYFQSRKSNLGQHPCALYWCTRYSTTGLVWSFVATRVYDMRYEFCFVLSFYTIIGAVGKNSSIGYS